MMTGYFKRSVLIYVIAALAVAAASFAAPAPAAKGAKKHDDGALVLERANSNENIYNSATGEFVSHLRGNVVFRFEDMRIRSDEATWQKTKGIVDFRKNVKVEQNGQVMTCDRLNFVRDNNLLAAKGNVNYRDSAEVTFMKGNDAEYRTDTKVATLWGQPLLTRIDSTETDTLFIRGRIMSYNDSTKIATITDAVNLKRGDLTATCRTAYYYTETNVAKMRTRPMILYERHRIVGDSVDLYFSDRTSDKDGDSTDITDSTGSTDSINATGIAVSPDSAGNTDSTAAGKGKGRGVSGGAAFKGASVMGNAYGYYREIGEEKKDTTVTKIWSDSLYIAMFESGKLDVMKAFGNARGTYDQSGAAKEGGGTTKTNLKSDSLHLYMYEETGKMRVMKAYGGAACDYTEVQADTAGADKAATDKAQASPPRAASEMAANITGDSLHTFMFENGKIRGMSAYGSARAVYSEKYASGSATTMDIKSDSMRVAMHEEGRVRAMRAFGNTHGRSAEWGAAANDSMITHIWSDSLRVQMSDAGKVRTMKAFGSVRSLNFMLADSLRANEVSGETMTLAFDNSGRIDQALVRGGAESLYYLDEEEGGGFNKAAGDVIHVAFDGGKPKRLRVRGNVKGHYAP